MRLFVVCAIAASAGCSLIVNTDCFQGGCDGGSTSPDATVDVVPHTDAGPDVPLVDGGSDADVADVATDTYVDPCATTQDPCRNIAKGYGGCYCGTSTQSGFDSTHANPSCLYRCNDSTTPATTDHTHDCAGGCVVAASGSADYCTGQPCSGTSAYCNSYCGGP